MYFYRYKRNNMGGNIFGKALTLITFGESHGIAVGGVLDGFPAGIYIDADFIQQRLNARRPGQSRLTTRRDESDKIEILSGVFENKSLGTPIAFLIRNKDVRPEDYEHVKMVYRPSHADYTYEKKYGIRDYRGGGRASARETAARVAAGAFAMLLLDKHGIKITAWTSGIGTVSTGIAGFDASDIEKSPVRCPDEEASEKMIKLLEETEKDGDTLGGTVSCLIKGVPPSLGEPVFDKLNAELSKAMMSINAVKGFETGDGFGMAMKKGSEVNDLFINKNGKIRTETNHSGGIQGGISNGEDIFFRVAFKPVPTIMKPQKTVDREGNETILINKGRHDVCVVPRAVPVVEAMAALVLADHLLRNTTSRQ